MNAPATEYSPDIHHSMELDVHIFDTDCFGVMWHGSYVKWLEMGRVRILEDLGVSLTSPESLEYIFPVTEQHFRYRSPAAYGDKLTLTTRLSVEGYKLVFPQTFESRKTGKITMEARTTVVITDREWRPQRRLPAFFQAALGDWGSESRKRDASSVEPQA